MADKRFYYLALPTDVVPEVLLELVAKASRVNVVFQSEAGHVYRIAADGRPEVKLCCLDVSIDELKAGVDEMAVECRGVRSEVIPMALHLGLEDEIPTSGNSKTWPSLVQRIHHSMHANPGPSVSISKSGTGEN